MNKEQLQQKIVEYFEKLPKEAQDVFSSMGWLEILKTIGGNYKLNENQIELLGTETTLVLLGIIHIDEYQKIIETEMGLSEDTVKTIYSEINDNILKTIKDKLIVTFESNVKSLGEENLDPSFSTLPESVQEAIANSDWKEKLYEIAGKYKLTVSQMGILEEITVKVMNNEIKPDLYENELATKIVILREDITNIVNEINEGILKRIREVMRDQEVIKSEELGIKNNKKSQISINTNEVDADIPLPPYAKPIKDDVKIENKINTPPIPETEKIKENPKPIQTEVNNVNTQVTLPKNILEDKLSGIVASSHNVSDYSIPKINNPSSDVNLAEKEGKPKSFDPYREQF